MVETSFLQGCIVLVVEDETLVSLDLMETLSAAGAHVVCAKRMSEAVQLVESCKVTAAILDINLGDHDCAAVCRYLREHGIPFLFHTGYSAPLDGWSDIPVVKKPSVPQEMVEAVSRLCGQHHHAAHS